MNRAETLAEVDSLEREQSQAESMLIASIIYEGDHAVAMNALDEVVRGHGMQMPTDGGSRNLRVLNAVVALSTDGGPLTADNIADHMRGVGQDPPVDFLNRVCAIAADTGEFTPFAYARRVVDTHIKRQQLGQRVWTEALYRWFDWDNRLLYIGITRDLAGRQESHSRSSSWGRFAAACTVDRYPTRAAVETAERLAIEDEQPLFNHVFNDSPEARQRLVEYLVEKGHLDLLTPAVNRG